MTEPLWELDRATVDGREQPRLSDVTLTISTGTTAVIGPSGAGKTTLLNLLVEFERPATGISTFKFVPPPGRMPIFWVPQNEGLWPHLTVMEHLTTVMPGGDDAGEDAVRLLMDFDLGELRNALPGRLSEGERARLAVARALASQASVLVMDEPLVHVDPARVGRYWEAVRAHCRRTDTSLVFSTHQPATVLREAECVLCFRQGRLSYAGSVEALYQQPPTAELTEFLGPANWFEDSQAARWLDGEGVRDGCYRPEQLEILPTSEGGLLIESTHFGGAISESKIRNPKTGDVRQFHHRSSRYPVKVGDRVLLRVCMLLLSLLMLGGCQGGDDREFPISSIRHWHVPQEGIRVPAPRSVTAGPNDEVYVLDNAGRILVYDTDGEILRQWWMPEYDVGKPEGICVLKDGRVAVADTHYHRVVFFDQNGTVLSMQGTLGNEPGQFIYPVAVIQDPSENLYVSEYGGNDRVQKFSPSGEFLLEFGRCGMAAGEFQLARGMVWHEGKVYVADATNSRIQVFADTGEFLEILGEQQGAPELIYPYDIAKSPDGLLYVVEYGANRVSCFNFGGQLLGRLGRPGGGLGEFVTPWGLTVDAHSRILVADTGNRRIVELQP